MKTFFPPVKATSLFWSIAIWLVSTSTQAVAVAAAVQTTIVPQVPTIPQRSFAITDFGAVGDGTTMNTEAFRKAIDACDKAGGGRIIVPEGSFLTSPFELRSAMDLHLAKGATVKMSERVDDYAGTKRERLGFITATDAKDVQISGEGTIDGQGEPWWAAFRKTKGTAASKDEPRRPQMIAFTRCERVKLEGFTTLNPPNTHCSLSQCHEVTIEGLTMLAPEDSPNTDALNLKIRNAVIRNCHIATGDDNIVFLTSEPAKDGGPGVENVLVSNCKLGTGHGLSFGSFTAGGISNITAENITFEGTTAGIRMKASRDRGGLVENLTFRDITMKRVKYPVFISSYYPKEPKRPDEDEGQAAGAKIPQWRNITIENGTIEDCPNSILIWGLPEQPITGVTLRNLHITAKFGAVVNHARDIRFEKVDLQAGQGAVLTTFHAHVEGLTQTPPATGTVSPAAEFHPGKVHIVLCGDSTVTDNAGWGKGFADCLKGTAECVNLALGGRSSSSFIKEGSWQKALALKPDYVLIQFGHNDQPGHGDRESDPETTYKKWMTQYVEEARAAGIKPVLVTSLSRREWQGAKIVSKLAPWANAVKAIAAEKSVPLVDLHALSIRRYEEMGLKKVLEITPLKNVDPNSRNSDTTAASKTSLDGTHLNEKGGALFGALVADELRRAVPELEQHIKPSAPEKIADVPAHALLTVAADGSGDFKTIQEALVVVPDENATRTILQIKAGTYEGPIVVSASKRLVTFKGDDAEKTIITWNRNVKDSLPEGADGTNPGVHIMGDGFRAENITFRNTSGDHGQGLALRIDADRAVFHQCRLLGWQDTLMANKGRQYFKDCHIEGRVDFIYGDGAALFDQCRIHSKNGGYITAPSTPPEQPFGFVFLRCKLTGDAAPWIDPTGAIPARAQELPNTWLGRPWRPHGSAAFVECEMGAHIKPEGWHNWGKQENEATARFAEYGNTGLGAQPEQRVAWAKRLDKEESSAITPQRVLAGKDNWNPAEESAKE